MPTPFLAIVADDLTGALDAAAPFSSMPGGVAVATRPEALGRALAAAGAGVVAVSTRSREIGADAAGEAVAGVLAALPAGVRVLKKIDSRLKGNIAAELAAFGARPLLVAPAIPEFGRVVRDGALSGFGVPVPLPVRAVLGPAATQAQVPDIATQAELAVAVAAAAPDVLLVGARGLAQAVAEVARLGPVPPQPGLAAPACFAVGSTDPISLAQVAALRAARPDLLHVVGPSGRLPWPDRPAAADLTLLQAVPGPEAVAPATVAADFADGAAAWLRQARSMLLTGGATAEAVLDVLGIDLLSLAGEALPGLPFCRAAGQEIVTKSGGFGAPDAFVRLAPAAGGAT